VVDRPNNLISLIHEYDGTAQSAVLGSGTVIENSLCRVRAAGSSITAVSGGSLWNVNVDLEFLPPMRGPQNGWALARDTAGNNAAQGWISLSPARVPYPTPAPLQLTVNPASSTAMTQTFTYTINAGVDGKFVKSGIFLINSQPTSTNGCYVAFNILSRKFTMDAHLSSATSGTAGTTGTLTGTMCSLALASSQISTSSTAATITAAITFSSSFGGNKTNYLFATDRAGRSTDLTGVGTWTGNAVLKVSPQESFNVLVNQARTLEAKCSGQAIAATWSIVQGQGYATLSTTSGTATTVTATGIPPGAYIAVQAQADCPAGGSAEGSIAYLYMDYFTQPAGPNVSPSSGTGANQNFWFWWSIHVPTGGVVDGTAVEMLYAPDLTSANNRCYLLYYGNTVYLRSDGAATWQPVVNAPGWQPSIPGTANPSSPYYTENSQCRFSWAGAYTTQDGFNRHVILPMTLKPAFSGLKYVYTRMNTTDNTNTTGFTARGSWLVP